MSENDPSWPTGDEHDATPPPPPPAQTPPPPPAPAPPPPGPTAGIAPAGASLGVRFGARLIDGLIIGIASAIVNLVVPGNSVVVNGIVGAVIGLGYYVYFETSAGATPAKQLLNLEVAGAGGLPTVEESVKRNIFLAFQIVPLVGGLASLVYAIAIGVTIQTSDDNRGLHDDFAGTVVRRT